MNLTPLTHTTGQPSHPLYWLNTGMFHDIVSHILHLPNMFSESAGISISLSCSPYRDCISLRNQYVKQLYNLSESGVTVIRVSKTYSSWLDPEHEKPVIKIRTTLFTDNELRMNELVFLCHSVVMCCDLLHEYEEIIQMFQSCSMSFKPQMQYVTNT